MVTSIAAALEKAGYDASGDEMFVLVSQMRSKGESLRAIEDQVWKRCLRRPVLFGPIIAVYVAGIDADMNFRREPDGGAREGHEPNTAANSDVSFRPEPDGGHFDIAREGQGPVAADIPSGEGHSHDAGNGQFPFAQPDGASREDRGQVRLVDQTIDDLPASRDALPGGHTVIAHGGHQSSAAVTPSGEGQHPHAVNGHVVISPSPDGASREDRGQRTNADQASTPVPASSRDAPLPPARVPKKPGAGAMGTHAYETRAKSFGESWLLNYAIPGGPRLLSLRAGDVQPMMHRLTREGAARGHAALVLHAIGKELQALGRVNDNMPIDELLSSSAVERITKVYAPANVLGQARKHFDRFIAEFRLESGNA